MANSEEAVPSASSAGTLPAPKGSWATGSVARKNAVGVKFNGRMNAFSAEAALSRASDVALVWAVGGEVFAWWDAIALSWTDAQIAGPLGLEGGLSGNQI